VTVSLAEAPQGPIVRKSESCLNVREQDPKVRTCEGPKVWRSICKSKLRAQCWHSQRVLSYTGTNLCNKRVKKYRTQQGLILPKHTQQIHTHSQTSLTITIMIQASNKPHDHTHKQASNKHHKQASQTNRTAPLSAPYADPSSPPQDQGLVTARGLLRGQRPQPWAS
jgi:hypothetical protein